MPSFRNSLMIQVEGAFLPEDAQQSAARGPSRSMITQVFPHFGRDTTSKTRAFPKKRAKKGILAADSDGDVAPSYSFDTCA